MRLPFDAEHNLCVFSLPHTEDSVGFRLENSAGVTVFAYVPDTAWCVEVAELLAMKPRWVLIDMNGGPSGAHLSREEIVAKALPITGDETTYVGTHLYEEFEETSPVVRCARPGAVFHL